MNIHLILDETSVAEARGVTFHLNPAKKHPENPVMLPGEPHQWDSLCVSWPGAVLYSPRDRKFRCWYSGLDVMQTPDRTWHCGYAESDDGIHWTKPDVGQVELLGKPTNWIKPDWNTNLPSLVFENPRPDAPPSQRFGGYWGESRAGADKSDFKQTLFCKSLAWSPDGKTWTRAGIAYGEMVRAPFLDVSQLIYDPADPDPSYRWKAYGQLFKPRPDGSGWPGIRHIALAHGNDPLHLEEPPLDDFDARIIFAPEKGIDEEIHFAAVQKIGATYLMLFESDRFSNNPLHGDLRLAVSKDGRHFRRIHPHTPLVATGPRGMWDENLLVTNSAGWQEVGDEIRIHYFGCPRMYQHWPAQYAVNPERRGFMFAPVYLGLATLPRDRFAYAAGPGVITTHAREIGANGIWLNAEGEGVSVTALDPAGKPTARGTLSAERRQTVYRKVSWEGTPPRHGKAQIQLEAGCKLYSILHDSQS